MVSAYAPPRTTLTDRMPNPYFPASTIPDGDWAAATAMGKWGRVYGRRCRRASFSVNHSDL